MSCDCGFFLSVDFLYFYGAETNVSYATKGETIPFSTDSVSSTTNYLFTPTSVQHLDSKWDPGVRVGLGWNTDCDGWDLSFYWTYYRNTSKQSRTVDNPTNLFPADQAYAFISQWGNPAANTDGVYNSASGNWKFTYNNFDLVMGKRYWLSKCFTLRPFTGLRGTWTDTDFSATLSRDVYLSTATAVNSYSEKDAFENETWGVGFVAGFEPTFFFTPCFSLYGSADMSLAWGNHTVKKTETYLGSLVDGTTSSVAIDTFSKSSSSYYYMLPALDLGLGLRWENYYCSNEYHLAIDLGWEHHVLFHLNDRYQLSSVNTSAVDGIVGATQYTETHHDVSFGGLVLRVRFDF